MSITRLLVISVLLIPLQAWSSYDPGRIKDGLAQESAFQINGWEQEEDGWKAQTGLRGVSLMVLEDRSEMVAPYINMKQKTAARQRCETMGEIVLAPKNKQEREDIAKVVKYAAQYHLTKFTDKNGIRFEVTPVLKGAYVRLSCVVRRHQSPSST